MQEDWLLVLNSSQFSFGNFFFNINKESPERFHHTWELQKKSHAINYLIEFYWGLGGIEENYI